MKMKFERKILRHNRNEWCELDIVVYPDGRFALSGAEGQIVTMAEAKRMAKDYWTGFFEDMPDEMKRLGKRTPGSAAKYVLEVDGDLHGIDVHHIDGNKVYILQSCGQIREDLTKWFPEATPYFKYHLKNATPRALAWAKSFAG